MSTVSVHRDYGLLGPESEKAAAAGLVSAKWYAPNISRVELKELMKREDAPAIRDTLIGSRLVIGRKSAGLVVLGTLDSGSVLHHLRGALRLRFR